MNIPQEAVEAAARAIEFHHDWCYEGDGICCMGCGIRLEGLVPCNYDLRRSAVRRHQAQLALNAALPAIEKEIRTQAVADIWEYWDACGDLIYGRDSALRAIDAIAARIAGGAK